MKKALLGLLFLFTPVALAQNPPAITLVWGTSLPPNCTVFDRNIFMLVSGTTGVPYYCSAANTWTIWSGGGGGGNIEMTTNALVGDGAGNAVAASGTGTNCLLVNGSSGACGGSPGGADTNVQFNNSGSFGGSNSFTYVDSPAPLLKVFDVNGGTPLWVSGADNNDNALYIAPHKPAEVASTPGTAGNYIYLQSADGSNTSIASTGVGGAGGTVDILSGAGGVATMAATAATGGAAGNITLFGNGGGLANTAATNVGGVGATITLSSGEGGAAAGGASNTGGNAGNVVVALNTGGSGSTANGSDGEFRVDGASTVFKVSRVGVATLTKAATTTNCADSAGAAACGSAAAGAVVVDAGSTSVVVSTTAVTANSRIMVMFDSSLGTELGITCNTTVALPAVTAKTAATSFTITIPAAPVTDPACFTYWVVN